MKEIHVDRSRELIKKFPFRHRLILLLISPTVLPDMITLPSELQLFMDDNQKSRNVNAVSEFEMITKNYTTQNGNESWRMPSTIQVKCKASKTTIDIHAAYPVRDKNE